MRLRMLVIAGIGFGLTGAALAATYSDLVTQGYRWITVDGPYACPAKEDVQRITNHRTDALELQMVDDLRAYYLIPGTLVKVIKEDPATGTTQVRLGGITKDLWTATKFLSKSPIQNPYGVIETPDNSDRISTGTTEACKMREQPMARPPSRVSATPSVSPMV